VAHFAELLGDDYVTLHPRGHSRTLAWRGCVMPLNVLDVTGYPMSQNSPLADASDHGPSR
jgi:hypothetical protein